jgi:hypothetical protein
MSSRAKKVAHLREHLPYELHMLRHTFLKFTTVHDASDWNAYFVAFAVYARNLHDFLRTTPTVGTSTRRTSWMSSRRPSCPKRSAA